MAERIELSGEQLDLAVQLRDYIRDRAAVEGAGFDLSLEFFGFAVLQNYWVFGVYHDGKRLLRDEQEPYPGYFREWIGVENN